MLEGWGVRPWDWQLGASIQQEVLPRVSVEVGYHRRWFGNFFVTHNQALSPADFDRFPLKAPSDPKLPDSGSYSLTYYDVKPAKFGQVNNYYTFETDYAPCPDDLLAWSGHQRQRPVGQRADVSGRDEQRTRRRDTCALWAALPELIAPQNAAFGFPLKTATEACHVDEPVSDQYRGLLAYEVPKIQLQLAATFRSVPGTFTSLTNVGTTGSNGFSLNAVYTPTPAEITNVIGRPQSNPNAQSNLLLPGQMYTPRSDLLRHPHRETPQVWRHAHASGIRPVQPLQQQHRHGAQHELRRDFPQHDGDSGCAAGAVQYHAGFLERFP